MDLSRDLFAMGMQYGWNICETGIYVPQMSIEQLNSTDLEIQQISGGLGMRNAYIPTAKAYDQLKRARIIMQKVPSTKPELDFELFIDEKGFQSLLCLVSQRTIVTKRKELEIIMRELN